MESESIQSRLERREAQRHLQVPGWAVGWGESLVGMADAGLGVGHTR